MKYFILVIAIALLISSGSAHLGAQTILMSGDYSPSYTGSGSTWDVGQGLTIGISGSGSMQLYGGAATVTSAMGTLAQDAGSNGSATINSNARWENAGFLTVGESGSGSIFVYSDGYLSSVGSSLGKNAGSNGSVDLYGGVWENSGDLTVGESFRGTFNLFDGSRATSSAASIGKNAGGEGAVTIADAEWENFGDLSVGGSGQAYMTVERSGNVYSDNTYMGENTGGRATVFLSDSSWRSQHDFVVGHQGSATLYVDGNSFIRNQDGFIGRGVGSTGTVNLSSSQWRNSGGLTVGGQGSGTLLLDSSSEVISSSGVIGQAGSSTGIVTLSNQSSWEMTEDLIVGEFGSGTLTIDSNSSITNVGGSIGLEIGSTGLVTVKSGAQWTNSETLYVSRFGDGKLVIDGGTVTSKEGNVATQGIGSTGEVLLGQNSRWDVEEAIQIGGSSGDESGINNSSVGILRLEGDSQIKAGSFDVSGGTDADRRSIVSIKENSGLEITSGGGMSIEKADVTFESGAVVFNFDGNASIGSRSEVTVTDSGTYWYNREMSVGGISDSILNIENGGFVGSDQGAAIGTTEGTGSVKVSGAGSQWTNNGPLTLGNGSLGELMIESGGRVTSQGDAYLGFLGSDGRAEVSVIGSGSSWHHGGRVTFQSGSNSRLNVGSDASVQIDGVLDVSTDSQVNLSGGTMTLNTVEMDDGEFNLSGGVATANRVEMGGGLMFLSGGKLDVGVLDLSFSGPADFNMTGGRLVVDTIVGDFQQDGGTLAPGDSPGLTSMANDYNMISGVIEFEIGGDGTRGVDFDAIDVAGIATLNGTMDVNFINSFTGMIGQSFQLVNAADIAGMPTFDFSDAVLSSGLAWDTREFTESGTIFIASFSAVPEPTSLFMFGLACSCLAVRRRQTV